jgi:hypothetical protein
VCWLCRSCGEQWVHQLWSARIESRLLRSECTGSRCLCPDSERNAEYEWIVQRHAVWQLQSGAVHVESNAPQTCRLLEFSESSIDAAPVLEQLHGHPGAAYPTAPKLQTPGNQPYLPPARSVPSFDNLTVDATPTHQRWGYTPVRLASYTSTAVRNRK